MPKLIGVRERRHQPYYDTVIRADIDTAPSPTVQSEVQLFNGTNLGLEYWTNMKVAGVFASDETYVVLAIRVWLWFNYYYALTMWQLAVHQMYLTLVVGDKPQFQGPAWLFPAGGGIFGQGTQGNLGSATNGVASADAMLKLAKPIPIPARQHFHVKVNFYDTGSTSLLSTYLNASASIGKREIKVFIDGLHTRDVL
jgi:hypothetical protein